MKVYSETDQINITPNTTIKQLKDMLNINGITNVKLVFGDGQVLSPVVFKTDQYDNLDFKGHELKGSYILTPKIDHISLLIWSRDDYGNQTPTTSLVATNKTELLKKYKQYIRDHRNMEDYLEDEEFNEIISNITLDDKGPELNSVYITDMLN